MSQGPHPVISALLSGVLVVAIIIGGVGLEMLAQEQNNSVLDLFAGGLLLFGVWNAWSWVSAVRARFRAWVRS